MSLSTEQNNALALLNEAFTLATETGLFDEMQGHCNHPDAINDVCDAAQHLSGIEPKTMHLAGDSYLARTRQNFGNGREIQPGENFHLKLLNGGEQSGLTARAVRSSEPGLYEELVIEVLDEQGELVACCLAGLHPDTLKPQFSITTDGMGEGDMNVIVDPTAPAECAVTIDAHASQAQRVGVNKAPETP